MKTYVAKPSEVEHKWYVFDAADQVLGRSAVAIARVLMGKHKPIYTPHVDTGDFVIVLNAARVKLTGKKPVQKLYYQDSDRPGGQRIRTFQEMIQRRPTEVVRQAVKRMLPKTTLGRHMLKKLKVYAGPEHRHQAQQPEELKR